MLAIRNWIMRVITAIARRIELPETTTAMLMKFMDLCIFFLGACLIWVLARSYYIAGLVTCPKFR